LRIREVGKCFFTNWEASLTPPGEAKRS